MPEENIKVNDFTVFSDLFSSLTKYGYQLVTANTAVPKAITDPQLNSIEAVLRGNYGEEGSNEAQPTVVVVAHYDSDSIAPSLPSGVDSNGSGVAVLLGSSFLIDVFKNLLNAYDRHVLMHIAYNFDAIF